MGLLHPSPIVCGLGHAQNIHHKRMTTRPTCYLLLAVNSALCVFVGGVGVEGERVPISATYPLTHWAAASGQWGEGGGELAVKASVRGMREEWGSGLVGWEELHELLELCHTLFLFS